MPCPAAPADCYHFSPFPGRTQRLFIVAAKPPLTRHVNWRERAECRQSVLEVIVPRLIDGAFFVSSRLAALEHPVAAVFGCR